MLAGYDLVVHADGVDIFCMLLYRWNGDEMGNKFGTFATLSKLKVNMYRNIYYLFMPGLDVIQPLALTEWVTMPFSLYIF